MHPKCEATGKRMFPDEEEARFRIYLFRLPRHNEMTGMRVKHRIGKPAQRRAYLCPDCGGYHITSWSQGRVRQAARAKLVKLFNIVPRYRRDLYI